MVLNLISTTMKTHKYNIHQPLKSFTQISQIMGEDSLLDTESNLGNPKFYDSNLGGYLAPALPDALRINSKQLAQKIHNDALEKIRKNLANNPDLRDLMTELFDFKL